MVNGFGIVALIALYFVIKWAVKNGIKEAYEDITGKKPDSDTEGLFCGWRHGILGAENDTSYWNRNAERSRKWIFW